MNFFDSIINEVTELVGRAEKKTFLQLQENSWKDTGFSEVILQRDTAFELDGVGFNLVTTSEVTEGITVVGDNLADIDKSRKFARICIVQLEPCDDEQETYKLIKKVDYVKYHHFPQGYMIRTTSRSHKESVRVAESAVRAGVDFAKIGSLYIGKCKEIPKVKAVRAIYITEESVDYKYLEDLARKTGDITETLNHVMNSVNFDCDTCSLKAVCDEVEGMKELHFSKGRS